VSPACELTHEVFSVGGGRYARVFVADGPGWFAGKGVRPTLEDIAEHIGEIRAEDGYVVPTNVNDDVALLLKALG
jgi:hypothetical protein